MVSSTYRHETSGTTDWKGQIGRTIRTDGCVIFLCIAGRAVLSVNMHDAVFREGDMAVLTSDVWFSVSEVSDDFVMRYISLSETMMEAAYYKITNASLWDYLHYAPILRLSTRQRGLLSGWFEQSDWILNNFSGAALVTMLNNNLHNLFMAVDMELSDAFSRNILPRKDRAWDITCRFWSLLTKYAYRERSVKFYADALHITPDYLNKVCQRTYGMSPKRLVENQISVEIKSYLTDTALPVSEIALRLNFDDTSYMCRFFRRITGCSPLEFRSGHS